MARGRGVRETAPGTSGAGEAARLTREMLTLAGC
jgi:hypothetical protein